MAILQLLIHSLRAFIMKDLHLLNGGLYKLKREKGLLRPMGHGSKNSEIGIVVYQLIDWCERSFVPAYSLSLVRLKSFNFSAFLIFSL
jgi:hypothetical protein